MQAKAASEPLNRHPVSRVRVAETYRVILPLGTEPVAFRTEPGALERFGLTLEVFLKRNVPLNLGIGGLPGLLLILFLGLVVVFEPAASSTSRDIPLYS